MGLPYRLHYIGQAQLLARFDRTLSSELVTASTLPRSATQQWLVKRPHESAVTHRHRISIVRQFAQFMCRSGYVAAVPPRWPMVRDGRRFAPRIFTQAVRRAQPGFTQSVSPHSLRHTKGMHLLQGGVSLEIIRDFLGHVDVNTTQIYARANLEMKRAALENITGESPVRQLPSWQQNKSLLEWLHSL